jgi:hypothetical protein
VSIVTLALLLLAPDRAPVRIEHRAGLLAPADVHAFIFAERDPRNRSLTITVDGDTFFRESVEEVNGEHDRHVWDRWWLSLPCGRYELRAELHRGVDDKGKQIVERAKRTFTVRGFECPDLDEAPQ